MAQTIDRTSRVDDGAAMAEQAWSDFDLALADARMVADFTERIEIWESSSSSRDERSALPRRRHDLSEQTIRELLCVVESLTRRESARRAGRPDQATPNSRKKSMHS